MPGNWHGFVMDSPILLDVKPPFALLLLNRPDKRNALNRAMWAALPALVDRIEADPGIKLVFLSGVDATAFAAGADIGEFDALGRDPEAAAAFADQLGSAMRRLAGLSKPAIAVVSGPCVGGGCGIALCCDFRFAAAGAEFGITPSRLGVTYLLEDTKRLIDAEIGLVDRVLPQDALWEEAERYGAMIAERSQYSVRAVKATIGAILAGASAETAATRRLFVESFAGEDLAEGAKAFLEKRPPRFTFS